MNTFFLNYNVEKKEYFICAVMYRNTQMKSETQENWTTTFFLTSYNELLHS